MKFNYLLTFFCLSSVAFAANADFGRVFTTPAERAELDSKRKQIVNGKKFISENVNQETATAASTVREDIELSGYIVREDGSAVVWINGRSELSGLDKKKLKASTHESQGNVFISTDGKVRSLKPGQVWLLDKNRVQESWQKQTSEPESSVDEK